MPHVPRDKVGAQHRAYHRPSAMISSTQGQHGTKYGASYSASKWGIIGPLEAFAGR